MLCHKSLLHPVSVNSHSRKEVPNRVFTLQVAGLLGAGQSVSLLLFLCSREHLAFNSPLNVLARSKCFMLIQEGIYSRSDLGFKKVTLASFV